MAPEDIINVLHIDDEQDQRYFTKLFLEKNDRIHLESEESYERALKRISEESFDCLLSDYQMPSMDGINLAKNVRVFSDIPIIIYTGRGSEEVASKAFSVGINDYVRKESDPAHYQVLSKRIVNVVEVYQTRKKNEELMRDSIRDKDILRGLIDALPHSIHLYDNNLNLINLNRVASQRGNIGVDDIGKNILDLSPNMKPDRYNAYKKVLETGEVYQTSNIYDIQNSGIQYVTITAFRVQDGLGIIFNDETQNRRLQEQLIRIEAKYRNLWEDSSDGHMIVDNDGSFLDFNSAFTEMIGQSKRDLLKSRVWDLAPVRIREKVKQGYLSGVSDGGFWSGKVTIFKPDGSHVVIDCLSQPIQINNQDVIHCRCKLVYNTNDLEEFAIDSEPIIEPAIE